MGQSRGSGVIRGYSATVTLAGYGQLVALHPLNKKHTVRGTNTLYCVHWW
jgi:hypothetical protein